MRNLDPNFSENEPALLHTAPHRHAHTVRFALQLVSAGSAHEARNTQFLVRGFFVEVAKANIAEYKLQFFQN